MPSVAPGVVALWHVVKGGRSSFTRRDWLDPSVVLTLVAGVFLSAAAIAGYSKNLGFVSQHVLLASSGPVAELYGRADSFSNSLLFWLRATQNSFFLPSVFLAVALICALGSVRHFVSPHVTADHATTCCASAVVQISIVLTVFSLNANREVRFLLPLLPYVSLLVSWGATRLDARRATIAVMVMCLVQFTAVHGESLRFTSRNLPFVAPIRDDREARTVDAIVSRTCPDSRAQGEGHVDRYWNIVGDSRPWLNENTLGYAASKKFAIEHRVRCAYTGIAGYFDADVNAGWNRVLSLKPHYYVATDPDIYPVPDDKVSQALDKLNLPLLNKVETSGSFALEPVLREDPGVMIFRQQNPGQQFSHARASAAAESSAVAEAGLPVARGALFGRNFELLGALMTPATEGMELKLAWRCVRATVLDRNVAVHFVDDSGKILAQADFPQDVGRAPGYARRMGGSRSCTRRETRWSPQRGDCTVRTGTGHVDHRSRPAGLGAAPAAATARQVPGGNKGEQIETWLRPHRADSIRRQLCRIRQVLKSDGAAPSNLQPGWRRGISAPITPFNSANWTPRSLPSVPAFRDRLAATSR